MLDVAMRQLETNRKIMSLVERVCAAPQVSKERRRAGIKQLHELSQANAALRDAIDREIEERR
jgi:hypothetical protein